MQRSVDVAIVGGGLSGNLLARQLRRQTPGASVAVFERDTERTFKVGESTVEIAANYLSRRLGLQSYLYREHLPKNGLRFFFDTEAKDAELTEMSELGTAHLPVYPSFQIDRARLERDLIEMNRADGVAMHVGARVTRLDFEEEGAHRLLVQDEGGEHEWRAKWIIDAAGRPSMVAKQLDLREPERDHKTASVWGRFRGVKSMDAIAAPEWQARVRHTSRDLSTNHFCYPDYWIWFIPLRNDITSVGIVSLSERWDPAWFEDAGFVARLREHRAIDQLLDGAELVDRGHLAKLAFRTKRFFGERWALVGDSAAFHDPFYSPGSDFIAITNDFIADLIHRDLAGEDIEERRDTYNEMMKLRFETALMLYHGQYRALGSYELFRAKCFFDCACYYNLWFDSYVRDEHLDLRKARGALRRQGSVRAALLAFKEAFAKAAADLEERGEYFRKNVGQAEIGPQAFGVMHPVGEKRKRPIVDRRTEEIFNHTRAMLMALSGAEGEPEPRSLGEFTEGLDLLAGGAVEPGVRA